MTCVRTPVQTLYSCQVGQGYGAVVAQLQCITFLVQQQCMPLLPVVWGVTCHPHQDEHLVYGLLDGSSRYRKFVLDWHSLKKGIYVIAFTPFAQGFGQLILDFAQPLKFHISMAVSCFLSQVSGCKAGSQIFSGLLKIFPQLLDNY